MRSAPERRPVTPCALGQRVDEDDGLGESRVIFEPGEKLVVPRVQPDIDRIEDDPGVGPSVEDRLDVGPQAIGLEGPTGGVVDRHGVDPVDIDPVRDLGDVLGGGVHPGVVGRQQEGLHALEGDLVQGAGEGRNGNQHGGGGRRADPVAVGLRHPNQGGLDRLVAAVEDKDLGRAPAPCS